MSGSKSVYEPHPSTGGKTATYEIRPLLAPKSATRIKFSQHARRSPRMSPLPINHCMIHQAIRPLNRPSQSPSRAQACACQRTPRIGGRRGKCDQDERYPTGGDVASAQSPTSYPWCSRSGDGDNYNICYFTSKEQCQGTTSGVAAFCFANPYYRPSPQASAEAVNAPRPPVIRPDEVGRRHDGSSCSVDL